ncbi:BatE [Bacteroides pyogenes DSM 20611 = JCM 6294]|uniref:BatE n=1 Tax=Bacteroides pyogenes DSM 20611 = JCM 6294 TaxID=1121100 RepID=W4PJ68_9BACE|nr:BatE [Bacteroides pyogenes DSM 20611 = JCM 6294]
MKKTLFIILLSISVFAFGQNSLKVEPTQLQKVDSAHVNSHTLLSNKKLSEVTKTEGDSAYIKNEYAEAAQIYEALLMQGEAAEVYYNLGNSYYKLGEIGKAVLNYERALLLQPGNSDIRANLEIARAKTIDKVEPIPEIFFIVWTKELINTMSVDGWALWSIVFFVLLIFSMILFLYSKQLVWKKAGFISGIICLVIVICSNLFAWQLKKELLIRTDAIVMYPSITVRSTPSENGTSLFILHEGRKIKIKDNSMKEWKEIRLENGKVAGYLPKPLKRYKTLHTFNQ